MEIANFIYLLSFIINKQSINNDINLSARVVKISYNNHIFGKKHTPEHNIIKSKTNDFSKEELKLFNKQYKKLIKNKIIIRMKKRTKKGSDWHISLNPEKLTEINIIMEENL